MEDHDLNRGELRNAVLLGWVKKRIKRNLNVIIIINGSTGSGKTYAGIDLCCDISKELGTNFTINTNLAFKFSDLLKKSMLPENEVPGTPFVFEEVGAVGGGASSMEWQSKANRFFSSFMQTDRHRQHILILTCPSFTNLQKGARELCHMQMEMKAINPANKRSYAKPFQIQVNRTSGKMYFKFLRFKHNGLRRRLETAEFKLPPKHMIEEYEVIKRKYTDQLKKEIIEADEETIKSSRKVDKDKINAQFDSGKDDKYMANYWDVNIRTIQRYKKAWKTASI